MKTVVANAGLTTQTLFTYTDYYIGLGLHSNY
jgi:hypothetical protein